ncbi:MAG: tetratricopeptide repeat protein [Planctomycetota bacterium]|jgi:tetratricopeptide (TPR) repeat protein
MIRPTCTDPQPLGAPADAPAEGSGRWVTWVRSTLARPLLGGALLAWLLPVLTGCSLPGGPTEDLILWRGVAEAEAQGDWVRAADLRQRLLREAGETRAEHYVMAARALERAGEPEAGLEILEEGLEREPCPVAGPLDPLPLFGERARMLVELGFCRAAEGEWLQALNVDPSAGEAWFELGCCRLRLQRAVEAAEAFERAFQAGFREPKAFAKAAKTQRLLGRPDQAHDLYVRAIEEAPEPQPTWLWEAAANHIELPPSQVGSEELARALEWARNSVAEHPNDADAHFVLGVLEERGGEHGLARETYRRAVELEPSHLGALTHLGRLSLRMERNQEAREMIERALVLEQRPGRRSDLKALLAGL